MCIRDSNIPCFFLLLFKISGKAICKDNKAQKVATTEETVIFVPNKSNSFLLKVVAYTNKNIKMPLKNVWKNPLCGFGVSLSYFDLLILYIVLDIILLILDKMFPTKPRADLAELVVLSKSGNLLEPNIIKKQKKTIRVELVEVIFSKKEKKKEINTKNKAQEKLVWVAPINASFDFNLLKNI